MTGLKRALIYIGGGWIIGLVIFTLCEMYFPFTPTWLRPALCIMIGSLGLYLSLEKAKPRDTVVYILRNKRRIVYVGIAYQHRAENRIAEHRRSGKIFTRVDWSSPMPRSRALSKEKNLIQRLQPRYNIAHCH